MLTGCDLAVRKTFEHIARLRLTDVQWKQAILSTSRGGLGLRSSALHAPGAYIASVLACAQLDGWDPRSAEDFETVLEEVRQLTGRPNWGQDGTFPNATQRELSESVDDLQLASLLNTSPPVDCARIRSCSSKGASSWLTAIPSSAAGTALANPIFNTSLRLWVGADVCTATECPFCHKAMDSKGYHALTCTSYTP